MSKIDAEAERVYDKLGRGAQADVKTIAEALLARDERAAKIVEQSGHWVAESDSPFSVSKAVWHGLSVQEIASAIRDRSKT